jgi:hypothetical protein
MSESRPGEELVAPEPAPDEQPVVEAANQPIRHRTERRSSEQTPRVLEWYEADHRYGRGVGSAYTELIEPYKKQDPLYKSALRTLDREKTEDETRASLARSMFEALKSKDPSDGVRALRVLVDLAIDGSIPEGSKGRAPRNVSSSPQPTRGRRGRV